MVNPLSPEMEELAQIVAKCIHELGSDRVPKQIVHSIRIETHGSARLEQFWKTKSKQRTVQQQGYGALVVAGEKGIRFREYRDRLVQKMIIYEGDVENDVGLEEIVESIDTNDAAKRVDG